MAYNDEFEINNLKVEIVGDPKTFVCSHVPGHAFDVIGENLVFDENKKISFYSLAGLIPLFAAKQRHTDQNDWMTTDENVACPDRNCGAEFRIVRSGKTVFKHSEATREPLKG